MAVMCTVISAFFETLKGLCRANWYRIPKAGNNYLPMLLAFIISVVLLTPASAFWFSGSQSNNKPPHFLMTFIDDPTNYLIFRCSENQLEIIYSLGDGGVIKDSFGGSKSKFFIRVDNNEMRELNVTLDKSKGGSFVIGDVDLSILREMENAKNNVYISIIIEGKVVHEKNINTENLEKSIRYFIKKCGHLRRRLD